MRSFSCNDDAVALASDSSSGSSLGGHARAKYGREDKGNGQAGDVGRWGRVGMVGDGTGVKGGGDSEALEAGALWAAGPSAESSSSSLRTSNGPNHE
ncbi:hypothetical protein A0H81_12438 [Grifola frondosa]|uniref:Uncharacterized protein n=1 Tax=Grifola frondosa TaxID=5627 RepID=A0A1C7LT24_GRIFR|nr:hypothetical protein A0H81_12438 [Grifola frondosa]